MKARQFIDEMAEFLYPGEETTKEVTGDHWISGGVFIDTDGETVPLQKASITDIRNEPVVIVGSGSTSTMTGIVKDVKIVEPAPPWLVDMVRVLGRTLRSRDTSRVWSDKVKQVTLHPDVNDLIIQLKAKVKARQAQWYEKYRAKHPMVQGKPVEVIADFSKNKAFYGHMSTTRGQLSVVDVWEQTIEELDSAGFRYFVKKYEGGIEKSVSFMTDYHQPGDQVYVIKGPAEIFILVSPSERVKFDRVAVNLHRRLAALAMDED
jgi:hypothetical protein